MKNHKKMVLVNLLKNIISVARIITIIFIVFWGLFLGILPFFTKHFFELHNELSYTLRTPIIKLNFSPDIIHQQALLLIVDFSLIFITSIIVLIILNQLRKIFNNLGKQKYFLDEHSKRIKIIGFTILTGYLIKSIINTYFSILLAKNITIVGVAVSPKLNIAWENIFWGLIIIILAEVFKEGAELEKDVEFTV